MGAEAALGVLEVVERIAAKGAHEGLARGGHGVLGVDGLEEEADGAVLGACLVTLLLDDRAEDVGVVSVERMAQVASSGRVHAQEGGDEQGGEVLGEHRLAQRGDGASDAVQEVEDPARAQF